MWLTRTLWEKGGGKYIGVEGIFDWTGQRKFGERATEVCLFYATNAVIIAMSIEKKSNMSK